MRPRGTPVLALAVAALTCAACASAKDVDRRGQALEARLEPTHLNHCPPEPLARGLAEIAFARSAARRGDPRDADAHLARAEAFAAAVEASWQPGSARPSGVEAAPCKPPLPPGGSDGGVPKAPDLDEDGIPDAADSDDDNDGISDVVDQCPRAAEDLDGYRDIDGCPDPDDEDGPP